MRPNRCRCCVATDTPAGHLQVLQQVLDVGLPLRSARGRCNLGGGQLRIARSERRSFRTPPQGKRTPPPPSAAARAAQLAGGTSPSRAQPNPPSRRSRRTLRRAQPAAPVSGARLSAGSAACTRARVTAAHGRACSCLTRMEEKSGSSDAAVASASAKAKLAASASSAAHSSVRHARRMAAGSSGVQYAQSARSGKERRASDDLSTGDLHQVAGSAQGQPSPRHRCASCAVRMMRVAVMRMPQAHRATMRLLPFTEHRHQTELVCKGRLTYSCALAGTISLRCAAAAAGRAFLGKCKLLWWAHTRKRALCLRFIQPAQTMMKAAGSTAFVWTGRGEAVFATFAVDVLSDAEFTKAAKALQVRAGCEPCTTPRPAVHAAMMLRPHPRGLFPWLSHALTCRSACGKTDDTAPRRARRRCACAALRCAHDTRTDARHRRRLLPKAMRRDTWSPAKAPASAASSAERLLSQARFTTRDTRRRRAKACLVVGKQRAPSAFTHI